MSEGPLPETRQGWIEDPPRRGQGGVRAADGGTQLCEPGTRGAPWQQAFEIAVEPGAGHGAAADPSATARFAEAARSAGIFELEGHIGGANRGTYQAKRIRKRHIQLEGTESERGLWGGDHREMVHHRLGDLAIRLTSLREDALDESSAEREMAHVSGDVVGTGSPQGQPAEGRWCWTLGDLTRRVGHELASTVILQHSLEIRLAAENAMKDGEPLSSSIDEHQTTGLERNGMTNHLPLTWESQVETQPVDALAEVHAWGHAMWSEGGVALGPRAEDGIRKVVSLRNGK